MRLAYAKKNKEKFSRSITKYRDEGRFDFACSAVSRCVHPPPGGAAPRGHTTWRRRCSSALCERAHAHFSGPAARWHQCARPQPSARGRLSPNAIQLPPASALALCWRVALLAMEDSNVWHQSTPTTCLYPSSRHPTHSCTVCWQMPLSQPSSVLSSTPRSATFTTTRRVQPVPYSHGRVHGTSNMWFEHSRVSRGS